MIYLLNLITFPYSSSNLSNASESSSHCSFSLSKWRCRSVYSVTSSIFDAFFSNHQFSFVKLSFYALPSWQSSFQSLLLHAELFLSSSAVLAFCVGSCTRRGLSSCFVISINYGFCFLINVVCTCLTQTFLYCFCRYEHANNRKFRLNARELCLRQIHKPYLLNHQEILCREKQ